MPVKPTPIVDAEEIKDRAATERLLKKDLQGKYRIELFLGKDRGNMKPTVGAISFWETGVSLHGHGDRNLFICPGKRLGKSACEAFIPGSSHGVSFLVCPSCQTRWQPKEVIDTIFGRHTMQVWAELLELYLRRLNHNADLWVKYSSDDLRAATLLEQQRQLKGDKLDLTRTRRLKVVYPAQRLVRDVANGSSVLSRIHAFLKV